MADSPFRDSPYMIPFFLRFVKSFAPKRPEKRAKPVGKRSFFDKYGICLLKSSRKYGKMKSGMIENQPILL